MSPKRNIHILKILLISAIFIGCSATIEPVDQGRFDDDGSGGSALVFQPAFTGVSPSNYANENNPTLSGTTEANVTVEIYTDSLCTVTTGVTGSSDGTGSFAISVPVLDDTVTTFFAQATDPTLGTSPCSSNSMTYTEDSTPPSVPTVDSSTPVSPSDITNPSIVGTGDANETITLYSDITCSTQIATGSLDGGGNYTLPITVTPGAANAVDVWANSTDAANNSSACSPTTLNYEAYTIPAGVAWLTSDSATMGNVNVAATTSTNFNFSRFDSAVYSHSTTTNSHLLTVTQAGDYLVTHNFPQTGTSGQRTNILSEIRINGVTVAPGSASASSYIRISSGHLESSNHNTIMLNGLSANDTIELIYIRATTITTAVNVDGLVSLYVEQIAASETVFAGTATQTTNGTDLNEPGGFDLEWTQTLNNGFTHSGVTPENIQINTTGAYMVHVNVPLQGTITRGNIIARVRVDGTIVDGGEAKQAYIRNSTGHNESSLHWSGLIPNINASSILTVNLIQEGANGVMNVLTGHTATIYVQGVDTTSNFIHLKATQLSGGVDNWNPAAKTTVDWATQVVNDPAVFSHTVGATGHQVTVLSDGDYYLVYNNAFNGNAVQRANPRITIQINGTDVPGATTKSHYMRASSQNEASGVLVFLLKDVSNGDVITVSAQQEATAGTVDDTSEALLTLWRK